MFFILTSDRYRQGRIKMRREIKRLTKLHCSISRYLPQLLSSIHLDYEHALFLVPLMFSIKYKPPRIFFPHTSQNFTIGGGGLKQMQAL